MASYEDAVTLRLEAKTALCEEAYHIFREAFDTMCEVWGFHYAKLDVAASKTDVDNPSTFMGLEYFGVDHNG